MQILIIFLAAILAFVAPASATDKAFIDMTKPMATEALSNFNKLVTEKNYRALGLESPEEVGMANMGEPLQVFWVRLNQLQKYLPGTDPNKLLSGGEKVIYPIMVKGQARSSITIAMPKSRGGSPSTSFGASNLTKLLETARNDVRRSTRAPMTSSFVVRVPALNLYFIGYRVNEKLMLTPILDDPGFGFKAGVTLPAEKVFETILPAAKKHKGLPG